MQKFKKKKGIVAAGHLLTAKAGAKMFAMGGNAVDAAVAASFATFIVEASLTGLYGGGFALVCMQRPKKNILFDFFVNVPGLGKKIREKELDFRGVLANFGGAKQEFHVGKASVGVPGNILGLCKLHQTFGRLPFSETLQPAIAISKKGFVLSKIQAQLFEILGAILTDTPSYRKFFAPQEKLLREGELFSAPELTPIFQQLANEGSDPFYRGEIADKMDRYFSDGGLLTKKDLGNYQVILRKPLSVEYRGEKILMNPKPSWGGELIGHSLKELHRSSFEGLSFSSAAFLETLVEAMKKTNAMRSRQQQKIKNLLGNTTHISVMDEEGNAVSLTTSHGSGAGFAVPGVGFPFNNMMGEADLNPLGFHKGEPGKRLSSMMCPTIALKKGEPHIVLGSAGSNRLRTAILQTLIKLIDFQMPIKKAVDSPRIHWEGSEFHFEPGFPERVKEKLLTLEKNARCWDDINLFFGGVHAVVKTNSKKTSWAGAGDPRRGGAVV